MGVLRFIWRGVLAFDRVGSRIPQLIQIWLVELFLVLPLSFFIGRVIDIHGAFGVPGTGESIGGVFWGALLLAVVVGFFFVRGLIRPRLVRGSWAPMVRLPIGGDLDLLVANNRARVSYVYLTSHPSYALLLLLTAPIPAVMVAMTIDRGDSTFYYRAVGIAGLVIIGLMAMARVLAWYVFKFGRAELTEQSGAAGYSAARLGWEIAWKPVLMLVVLCYAIVCTPLAVMFAREHRAIAALPVVAAADTDHPGQYYRVVGDLAGDPVYWAPQGTGRGSNNFAGAGVLIALDSGGQVLLLAESMAIGDFRDAVADAERAGGRIRTQGRVLAEITDDQRTYYGFDTGAFGAPPAAGRVLVLIGRP